MADPFVSYLITLYGIVFICLWRHKKQHLYRRCLNQRLFRLGLSAIEFSAGCRRVEEWVVDEWVPGSAGERAVSEAGVVHVAFMTGNSRSGSTVRPIDRLDEKIVTTTGAVAMVSFFPVSGTVSHLLSP